MKNVILNNGVKMPLLGFGTYLLREGSACEQSVLNALNIGYRLIDTASAYGNEESVGRAIKKSNVKREEIFVTTKFLPADSGSEKAKQVFEASLKKLGLEHIDLYLIHLPTGDINSTWAAMEELYKEGRVRAIGVSNFNSNQISDLIKQDSMIPVNIIFYSFCGRFIFY